MVRNQSRRCLLAVLLVAHTLFSLGQQSTRVYMHQYDAPWTVPVASDSIIGMTLADGLQQLLFHVGQGISVPFSIAAIDSITFENDLLTESKNPYSVFQLYINTSDGIDITSKEHYTDCHLALNAQGSFSNFSSLAQLRGRGNSSFLWYDKKPYRLKLFSKHKLLGLPKAKSWVLLANYRDVTDLMNTYVFETGRWMGLPFTNHTRYVELILNGDYKGVYQLTEQVQQNKNRVNVSDDRGILLTLDVDDGPDGSPAANDNFWTQVYHMPAAVKYPDDEHFTTHTVDSVRAVFAQLEQAIKDRDYPRVEQLLDVSSFVKYLLLQEFVYNVELSAPRSIFLHKDGDGPWVMGPLWDFDGGFDFDWSDMYNGHSFFSDYHETVMGTNPLKRNGQYGYIPQFFTDLFGCPEFVQAYKTQWAAVKDSIVSHGWTECMHYVDQLRLSGAMQREARRWPLRRKDFDTEVQKMHQWLQDRVRFMTTLVEGIPVPDTTSVSGSQLCGTLSTQTTLNWYAGYNQSSAVRVNRQQVLSLMGIGNAEFNEALVTIVPLNADGSEGANNTNGIFGGWFGADGNLQNWPHAHVFVEVYDDLWNWSCGLNNDSCYDDEHTVTMQLQYPHQGTLKKVNIEVHFNITENW